MWDGGAVEDGFYDELYLWVRPTERDLLFLGQQLQASGVRQVVSAGCGSGLLEWLLQSATGVDVVGLEVDRCWWESPYAPPTFLPLQYADEKATDVSLHSSNIALMFCYFNNGPAFREYMALFQGNCLVVIGPAEGADRHTDPEPFHPLLEDMGWTPSASREIQNTLDYIVVYKRKIDSRPICIRNARGNPCCHK